MATKSPFEPTGGMFSSDLWKNLDDDTKNLFRELLKQSGVGMQLQNENVRIAQSNFRPGQYMSERQRREIVNPESASERLQRLQFHGGVAGGRFISNYDEYMAASNKGKSASGKDITAKSFESRVPTAREDSRAFVFYNDPNGPIAWAKRSAQESKDRRGVRLMEDGSVRYSFGYVTEESRKRRDALTTLGMYSPNSERARRLEDLQDTYEMLKNDAFRAADKGGVAMRERGWLDAVFNGGIVRAALKGGKGSK